MRRVLSLFLPYSLLLAIGLAVVASNVQPGSDARTEPTHELDGDSGAARSSQGTGVHIDPVCLMEVASAWDLTVTHEGRVHYFCTRACRDRFSASPHEYLGDRCLVCRRLTDPKSARTATYLGHTYRLCSESHRRQFQDDPAAFFMHTMWGIPPWLYSCSIALVLVLSFGLFEWTGKAVPHSTNSSDPADSKTPPAARIDLLRVPILRAFALSRPFRFVCQAILVALFFLILAVGLFGNQNPALNLAPILTWTIWWGGLVLLILYAGKAWCYVCPWDAVAGWLEKMKLWKKTEEGLGLNLKWPRLLRNIALATMLFVGLTWIELGFGVTMKPRVTAYLGLAMLVMAIVSALLFERKSFCRYACLVGRVSGLYAMFSGIEVRRREEQVCRSCAGKECVHGGAEAYGCPTFLFPGAMQANTYCIQCAECLQACPEDNLALNLRPWGSDLVGNHRPRSDEAYLALLMLSITGFHGLTMTAKWAGLTGWLREAVALGHLAAFSLGMIGLMLAPILVYAVLAWISYRLGSTHRSIVATSYRDYFVRYAYALLPIALFYHLAHNLEHLLMEGPKVLSLFSDPFGRGWDLFGTLTWRVPPLVSLEVLWILQILLVLVGHVYSLWVAHRTALRMFADRHAAFRSQLPMLAGMILFSIFSLWLLKQPMEMRTSAM